MKSKTKQQSIVIIGGIDPTGHAGLLADAKVLQNYKMDFTAVTTALTCQSDQKFFASEPVPLPFFRQQLKALPQKIDGVKIGMLATLEHAKIVRDWLKKTKPQYVVWDPVLRSSSGGVLLKARRWNATLQNLLKQCHVFTPNIPEAKWILQDSTQSLAATSAKMIWESANASTKNSQLEAVLLKGGHDDQAKGWIEDILWDGKNLKKFRSQKKPYSPRGTGCTLASALLAELVQGRELIGATHRARQYVQRTLFKTL